MKYYSPNGRFLVQETFPNIFQTDQVNLKDKQLLNTTTNKSETFKDIYDFSNLFP